MAAVTIFARAGGAADFDNQRNQRVPIRQMLNPAPGLIFSLKGVRSKQTAEKTNSGANKQWSRTTHQTHCVTQYKTIGMRRLVFRKVKQTRKPTWEVAKQTSKPTSKVAKQRSKPISEMAKQNTHLQKWEERHPVWRTSTTGYQSTQRRVMKMIGWSADPVNEFQKCTVDLAHSTRASYWVAWMAAKKSTGALLSPEEKRYAVNLEKLSKTHLRSTTVGVTPNHINSLLKSATEWRTSLAVLCAFCTAHRISDIIQLHAENLKIMEEQQLVAITFTRGKVVSRIGPYTTFLGMQTMVAQTMIHLLSLRRNKYLFTEKNSVTEREAMGAKVRNALRAADPRLTQLSIRHGACVEMGLRQVPQETIRSFTQHKSLAMLHRYMEHGRWNMSMALTQTPIVQITDQKCCDSKTWCELSE